MNADFHWVAASHEALAWIRGVASNDVGVGFIVGPMPDQVYVLHPIFERVDGKPVQFLSGDGTDYVGQPDEDRAPLRRVTWADYFDRREVAKLQTRQQLFWTPGSADPFDYSDRSQDIWPPSEGNLDDAGTREALFDILIQHTTGGDAALCTAFHMAAGPSLVDSDILRGPLSAWPELFRGGHLYSPQNIWPDTHEWVVNTDPDTWATAISGPTALIEDLVATQTLETFRPAELR